MTNETYRVEMIGFITDDPDEGHKWNVVDYTWGGYGRVVDTVDSETMAQALADGLEKKRERFLGNA